MTFQPSLKEEKDFEVEVEVEEDVKNAHYKDGGEDSDLND
jgi:hypothetical protein